LSKPQVAQLQLLSWIDILAVATFAVAFLVGLPLLGGRVVRRQGRIRLPVWHVGRSLEPAFAPAAGAVGGLAEGLASGPVSEKPADTASQPEATAPEGQAVEEETASSDAADSAAVTEVFPAIPETPQTAGTGRPAALCQPAADGASSPGKANGTPATAISAASPANPRAAGERDNSAESVPTADGKPPYSRPVSPWVKQTTWPTWKGGKP
jgi:hypothetical protein